MVKPKQLVEAFRKMAPRYEAAVNKELQKFWGWNYTDFVDLLIDRIPAREVEVILDVATGTAVIPRRFLERGGERIRIVGLDITFDMLRNARIHFPNNCSACVDLTCSDAMRMPFRKNSFDVILCGLATHHMNVSQLLSEMRRVLKPGGHVIIADAGGSLRWRFPVVKNLIRIATFFYFLITENISRAWTEAAALPNVHTVSEWYSFMEHNGFSVIQVVELPKSYTWIPSPLLITAT